VVFDADGTLWRDDLGEDFLRHLARERHFGARSSEVYTEYERRLRDSPADAFGFAVGAMSGLEVATVERIATAFFHERFEARVFRFVRPLFQRLTRSGYVLWICSASPRLVVIPGAASLGIPAGRVIGVECEVRDGRLTSDIKLPVPCGDGKRVWLNRCGVAPMVAVGNGELDLEMLASAGSAVVIAPHGADDTRLVSEARARGWPILRVDAALDESEASAQRS
jgi:phosphoserine phosphatase